jgi:hypothetical protein
MTGEKAVKKERSFSPFFIIFVDHFNFILRNSKNDIETLAVGSCLLG